ncbi:MAG TPA: DUF4421 domain-containing protein [Chitinophagaceae bacterium]|nr:DUF4421 domain-containing protein [Chitinophagaceae bacterium]
MQKILILSVCFLAITLQTLLAQSRSSIENDPYYITFEEQITTRLYLAKKYSSLIMKAAPEIQSLRYRPNSLTTLGISGSYKALSLSFGKGFGFLNPNKEEKGKTRSFDFGSHIYTRDWVTDIYAQFYKGYYLSLGGPAGTADKNYYRRPDIKVNLLGASLYRLLNGERFSYRAGFLQNEWQKKSAGSALLGAEIYYGTMKGDSALVPSHLNSYYPQQGIERVRLLELGPGAGYAYTAVWEENLFLTGSLTINADISMVKEVTASGSANRTSVSPNATLRAVAGYNSEEWAATISWLHNATNAKGKSSNYEYGIKTGEFKITLAKRFTPGSKLKGRLDPIIKKMP